MKAKDYKVLLDLVRKYGISTILRFVADAWSDVWHEKYEIKNKETKMIEPQKEQEGMSETSEADDIEDLPPVTPTENVRHWIPVNERLPEKDGWYLVTTEEGIVETAYYKRSQDEDFNGWYSDTILAWLMMLPEPYKVESEDK